MGVFGRLLLVKLGLFVSIKPDPKTELVSKENRERLSISLRPILTQIWYKFMN